MILLAFPWFGSLHRQVLYTDNSSTTDHQKSQNVDQNRQELEEGPPSGPHLLVSLKLHIFMSNVKKKRRFFFKIKKK